jgi:8-oxo-dGTP diphosphatase
LVDKDYVLLVDHKKAGQWLPTGGHVDVGEHPRDTALREAKEELFVSPELVTDKPLMITIRETIGITAGHIDVSLWYVMKWDRMKKLKYDEGEFNSIKWFHFDEIPFENPNPNLKRFVKKLKMMKS